jgi:hypothetical protein
MSVEFLPSHEPDDDPGEHRDRYGRPHQRLWWVVVALLVVGAAVWAATRPSSSPRPVAAPSVTTAPRVDPECRHVPDCSVRTGIPAAIDRLMRAYLPGGVRLRVHTVVAVSSLTLRNQLVARDIDASANSVTWLIRVRRGGSGRQAIVPDPLGMGSLLLHGVNSGYVVRLQYLAPETVPPMLSRLQALLRDPRLISSPG